MKFEVCKSEALTEGFIGLFIGLKQSVTLHQL